MDHTARAANEAGLSTAQRWKIIRAQAARILARKPWDESEHPRVPPGSADSGQFAPSGGGSGKPSGAPQGELFPELPPIPEPKVEVSDSDFKDKVQLAPSLTDTQKASFLKLWNDRVAEAPEEFRQEFMGGLNGTMVISEDYGHTWTFRGKIQDANGDDIGTYTRSINFETNTASSDYFVLDKGETGKSVGKTFLAANVAKYQEIGLDTVEVHANIDVGGYAWAKYGYVPTDSAWDDLQRSLSDKVGGGGYTPESWDELTNDQQEEIKDAWKRDSRDEFLDSEIDNWRESGGALAAAKIELDDTDASKWAYEGLKKFAIEVDGTAPMLAPFLIERGSSIDAVLANTTIEFTDRNGDGSGDPNVSINAEATPELNDDQRAQIESMLVELFNKEAESRAQDIEAPTWLSDGIDDSQDDVWDGMRDSDKFSWARDNDRVPETGNDSEIDPDDAEDIRSLLDSGDPKAIWAIADSPSGKELLLGTDWSGRLDLSDDETLARFHAYVGKAAKA